MSGPGYFIVLEGIDGAGKSSSAPFIRRLLEDMGRDVVHTREPGGVPSAENIRKILMRTDNALCPETELLLFFAARIQHVRDLILPSLQAGKVVLCDRFTPSSYAYQGGGRGVDTEFIRELEQRIPGNCHPDLVLWLDIPVEAARERRCRVPDRFHQESEDGFDEKLSRVYRDLAARNTGNRWERIDAGQSRERMQACIADVIRKRLRNA